MKRSNIYYWLGFIAFFAGYMMLDYKFGWVTFAFALVWIGSMFINSHVDELQHERQMEDLVKLKDNIENSLKEMKSFRESVDNHGINENDFVKKSEQ